MEQKTQPAHTINPKVLNFVRRIFDLTSDKAATELYNQIECVLSIVEPPDWNDHVINTYFVNGASVAKGGRKTKVKNIYEVERKEELDRFSPNKAKSARFYLWHGTKNENVGCILQHGFKLNAAEGLGVFGRALYFTDVSEYAMNFCSTSTNSPDRSSYMILCEVQPMEAEDTIVEGKWYPDANYSIPSPSGAFIPLGQVKYRERTMDYGEYAIRNEKRICIRFIVEFEFI